MAKNSTIQGVTPLYEAFKAHLQKRNLIVAQLQLLGRIEDYLTKEFALVIMKESRSTVLPLINAGTKEEGRKIDIALLEGDFGKARDSGSLRDCRKECEIRAFIEVKYLRNRHRHTFANAEDEIAETFKSLREQLVSFRPTFYAKYPVNLRGEGTYGLVFASHVRRAQETACKAPEFVNRVKKAASEVAFAYHDLPAPQLDKVYEDVLVRVLNAQYRVSLYVGLWRLAPASATMRQPGKARAAAAT
ncbi:MAG: hypothetical protein L0Z53_02470 [Acidobacteriales bacterium]|nr:hypothetical protein [Terriglobales bacterium]